MNKHFTLADRLRAKTLERFHVVDMANAGNVAEHSFGVQIIAETLLYNIHLPVGEFVDPVPLGRASDNTPSLEDRYMLMKYAQIHDLPELISGDTPTPFKAYIRSHEVNADALMELLEDDALAAASPETIASVRATLNKHVSLYDNIMDKFESECLPELDEISAYFTQKPHLKIIAKIADILEAISVFSTGRGQDEVQNKRVEAKLIDALYINIEKGVEKLPNLNWVSAERALDAILSGKSSINSFEDKF
jgi:5'-deoxynucleotidase YfbR-like HD superfamily hydrolase